MAEMSGKLVLIIEDQQEVADVVQASLEALGLVSHQVFNANAALEFLQTNRPDLIILDIGLPGMSGWELLGIIQEWRKDAHIPILVTTAFTDPANRLVGKLQDVDHYLQKPFEVSVLQEAATRLLGLATS